MVGFFKPIQRYFRSIFGGFYILHCISPSILKGSVSYRFSTSIFFMIRNRNQIRKYFTLFIRGPDAFESWKNGGRKSRDTLPLRYMADCTVPVGSCRIFTFHVCNFINLLISNHPLRRTGNLSSVGIWPLLYIYPLHTFHTFLTLLFLCWIYSNPQGIRRNLSNLLLDQAIQGLLSYP